MLRRPDVLTAPSFSLPLPSSLPVPSAPKTISVGTILQGMNAFTPAQISALEDITVGTAPLLSLQHPNVMHEIIGQARAAPNKDAFIRELATRALTAASPQALIFSTPTFVLEREQYQTSLERAARPTGEQTGILECPQCRTMNTRTFLVAARSGDEGMVVVSQCQEATCKKRWSG